MKVKEMLDQCLSVDGVYYYGDIKDFIQQYKLNLRGDLFTQLDIIASRDIIPFTPAIIYTNRCIFIIQFYFGGWMLQALISPLGDEVCLE